MSREYGFIATLKREVRRLCSSPIYIAGIVLIPAFIAFFMLNLLNSGMPERVPCAVVDLDNTEMSREMVRLLDAMKPVDVSMKLESYTAAQEAVKRGDVFGLFVIPENFAKDALSFRSPQISLYSNYMYFIPGTLLYKEMLTTATLAKAALVKGVMQSAGYSDETIDFALMPIDVNMHPLENPWLDYNIYLSNSFIPCALALMIMLMTCYSVGMEIKHLTSREWLRRAGDSMFIAIAGKLLPQTLLFFIMGMTIDSVMYFYLDFPVHCSVLQLLLTMLLFVMSCQAFGLFVVMIVPNLRLSLSVCSLLGVLSFSVAGFSFPAEQMYSAVEIFSTILPVRYYFLIYIDQVLNGIDLYYSRFYYAALLGFMLLPILMAWNLRRAALSPENIP